MKSIYVGTHLGVANNMLCNGFSIFLNEKEITEDIDEVFELRPGSYVELERGINTNDSSELLIQKCLITNNNGQPVIKILDQYSLERWD